MNIGMLDENEKPYVGLGLQCFSKYALLILKSSRLDFFLLYYYYIWMEFCAHRCLHFSHSLPHPQFTEDKFRNNKKICKVTSDCVESHLRAAPDWRELGLNVERSYLPWIFTRQHREQKVERAHVRKSIQKDHCTTNYLCESFTCV